MMNWIRQLKNKIKRYIADPLKDPKCSGRAHVDSPICPYPDYFESMKPTPTCYNCRFSYYGAGPEGCNLHGDIILLSNDACPDYECCDMLDKILEQIRQLSEDQFIELIKKLEKEESKRKKAREDKNAKKAFEIGDKICELLGINGFPFSSVTKCWDAPYEPLVREYEDIWEGIEEYYEEDNRPTEETWNKALEYVKEFYDLIPESWCFEEKDARDCYPGHEDYMFYLKGGKTQFVTEDEFTKFYFG